QTFIAQNSTEQPLFKAETRQVLVDVVITDRSGHFIPGLKPGDFTVLEDNKPQKVAAFAVHSEQASPARPTAPIQLPPHQFTNYQIADPKRPITIVLMDVLNTQVQDQAYTRKQMIEFLRELPPGQRVALFALGTRLRTIQSFTGDSDTLVNAAKMLLSNSSPLMTSEAQRQNDEITASNLAVNAGPGSTGPSGRGLSASVNTALIAPVASGIQNALMNEQVSQQMQRMDLTLAALQSLARAVSAYPGRKNLLWLSAEFPVRFGPNFVTVNSASEQAQNGFESSRKADDLRTQSPPVHQTAALLTASQIAVYPIDIRGTVSVGAGIDLTAPSVDGSMERIGNIRDRTAARQTTMQWDDHEAMNDIARETGGQAFYGSNDLKNALSRSMEEGSNYYTIAYTPQNHDWNGKYRKIEVKCVQAGTKLTYRRGYYAVDQAKLVNGKAVEDQVAFLFATAMHPEAPTSTMVLLKVQVLPPDSSHKTVRIDYAINSQDVTFTEAPQNSKHVMLDLMAVAWDKEGKPAAEDSGKIDTSISADAYRDVMRSYIPAHQELAVKPGTYTLRLGVVDRNSKKIGTVDIPLTVPGDMAEK
ncbi:MAG TPA: VWA domain-containing protein, partial [Terriglobales bacterium]|nr:VWA domain-containing protein [Terriglobales bacterium]